MKNKIDRNTRKLMCKLFGHRHYKTSIIVDYDEWGDPEYEEMEGCYRCRKTFSLHA